MNTDTIALLLAASTLAACHPDGSDSPVTEGPPPSTSTSADESSGTTTSDVDPATTESEETETSDPGPVSGGTGDSGSDSDPGDSEGPVCGDGVIDDGEECDDGVDNSSTSACLVHCVLNVCGDGYTWAGVEQCDDGNNSNADACVEGCVAATCGDGHLYAGVEDCELGELNLEDGYQCSDTCTWEPLPPPRTVFVSSIQLRGDLSVDPDSLGDYSPADFPAEGKTGLPLADLRCQQLADLAGLTNAALFRAWLSDNNGQASSHAGNRILYSPPVPYELANGGMLASDWDHLADEGPLVPIDITEQGVSIEPDVHVWSNTSAAGMSLGLVDPQDNPTACTNWASMDNGLFGQMGVITQSHPSWTDAGVYVSCNKSGRLYCFESAEPGD